MARQGFLAVALLAMVIATTTTGVAADLAEDYVTGVSHFMEGAYVLADGGHLDSNTTKLVMETVGIMENRTHTFVKQYNEANSADLSWEAPSMTEEKSMVDGIRLVSVGSETILNVTTTISKDEDLFAEISNTTYFATMTTINDDVVMLLTAMETGMAEDSRRRRALLQTSDCDDFDIETASDQEIRDCYAAALTATTTSLSNTQDDLYLGQYNMYCKPWIRESYSNDLKDDFKDDKSLKTCNDFSFMGLFGATRCSECIRHASEDLGKEVTQEDCRIFDNDEQQWMLDETDDGEFLIRNDEEDDHCIQAPSSSAAYSQMTYTMQRCDKSNPAQKFEVLELDTWTGDPRIMFKVSGSGTPGLCMSTLEADDDDDMPFVNKPCICAKSQIIKRDD